MFHFASMKLVSLLFLSVVAAAIPKRDYANKQYFLVEVDTSQNTSLLHDFINTYQHVFKFEHPARALDDHFVFSKAPDDYPFLGNYNSNPENLMRRDGHETQYDALINAPGVKSIHMLPEKRLEKRLPIYVQDVEEEKEPKLSKRLKIVDSSQEGQKEAADQLQIEDPLFLEQWHLINSQYPGHDVNVKPLWFDGVRGKGISVAIVDDGLDYESEDLKANFNSKGSWDFNENHPLPKPLLFDDYHGTRCAGEVAAVKNDVCGIGVAYEAKVSGIRILSGPITAEDEAAAMVHGLDYNDIYSCSWGPTDNGRTLAAPDTVVKKAMIRGVQDGRDKKGAVYIFASGNGGRVNDQCNFDGYTNSIYSITVGAIDHKGFHPPYAEACSAVMVVTYSSGSGEHIHTTDIHEKCSAVHGGTSAAAPLAAGIYALVLSANNDLTWRDVQYISAHAAVPVNEEDGEYQETALGMKYSHKYGFGKIDAAALVAKAKEWKNVKPQAWNYGDVVHVGQKVVAPDASESETIRSTYTVSEKDLEVMNVDRLEHVTVKVNIKSLNRGKLDVRLISPFGLVSKLAWYRSLDSVSSGLNDWTFMSVVHWGEKGVGNWTLEVKSGTRNTITVEDWQIRLFGECKDEKKAEVYDLDTDYAKIRRERIDSEKEEATASETASKTGTASEAVSETGSETESMETATPSTEKGAIESGSSEAETEPEKGGEGVHEVVVNDHSWRYVFVFTIALLFIVFVYVARWQSDRSSSRRRRGDFEFDIIPNEDYSDTDGEQSFELQSPSNEQMERQALFDDFNDASLPDYEDAPNYENDAFQIADDDDDKGVESGRIQESQESQESGSGRSQETGRSQENGKGNESTRE